MKVFLMHRDQDFVQDKLPSNTNDLMKDLELKTLFDTMARGDEFLFDVVKSAVLSSLNDPSEISYRQHILVDSLEQAETIREIYDLAVEAIQREKKVRRAFLFETPDLVVSSAVGVLEMLIGILTQLRQIAEKRSGKFQSEGFVRFFTMLKQELDDEYFRVVQKHLRQLRFENGVLISSELGKGNSDNNYVLHESLKDQRSLINRVLDKDNPSYSFTISSNNSTMLEELDELSNMGIYLVANALVKSTEHILSFFTMLKTEIGFYVGCLNLHKQLTRKGEPTCIPKALESDNTILSTHGLYDVGLTLNMETRVVGNNLNINNKKLIMITGANQGGKSTFLRSVGLAQLMTQCGMFVAAKDYSASISKGVFTHFKRKEDTEIKIGKLDEELSRMNEIANHIKPGSTILCNESFSSTNEKEGSEIAQQISNAFLESGVKIFFVTHLFALAKRLHQQKTETTLFLRAERRADGKRTFRVNEGEPLSTSYGKDLYKQIFKIQTKFNKKEN